MNILYINDYETGGGAEVMCKITIDLFKGKSVFIEDLISKNKYIKYFNMFLFNPILYLKYKRMIKKYKPDIIHLHNYNLAPITTILALRKYKIIQTVHASGQICPSSWGVYRKDFKKCNLKPGFSKCMKNCFFDKPKVPGVIYYYWHRLVSFLRKKYISGFIFPSDALRLGFEKNGFRNLITIRNPIPFKIKNEKTKKENIILYVGKMIELKGVDLLVKALKELDINDWKFIFVGDGPLKNELVKETKDDKRFIFKGNIEHKMVEEFYKKSKIVVVPSVGFDNYPTSIIEGLIFSNIVLGSYNGGIPEMLDSSLLFKIEKKDIKIKLLDVINNYKTYKSLFHKSKKNILNNTEEKYVNSLFSFYKKNI